MGGGAAMRTAGKVTGIGIVNSGIRGAISSVPPPAEQAVRNASLPVSAMISSSHGGGVDGLADVTPVQRSVWEFDDWEFAGSEEDQLLGSRNPEPMPRVVFGGAPTLQEATAATTELKDALEKVYLSSPTCTGAGGSVGVSQLSGLSLQTTSGYSETKDCITCEPKGATVPKYAIRAFTMLNESPAVQGVVASIACDPKVWDAVMQNEALVEFIQSQKTDAGFQDLDGKESVADTDWNSPRSFTESPNDENPIGNFETMVMDVFENIKVNLVKMVSDASAFFQNIFGFSSAENASPAAEGNAKLSFMDKTVGASFMGLAMIVIMVVVMKRG